MFSYRDHINREKFAMTECHREHAGRMRAPAVEGETSRTVPFTGTSLFFQVSTP